MSKKPLRQDKGEKLAKYLARCGIGARRKCEEFIRAGWVTVDNCIVDTPESRILANQHSIRFRGELVEPQIKYRYILLNKPKGIVCTSTKSKEKGNTVLDLVKVPERVYNVGRLDKDSSGLLLLTNDGELAQRLMHPSFEKEKEYHITTTERIDQFHLRRLNEGILLEDGISRFKSTKLLDSKQLKVVLTQGRKRQIRRTLQAIGMRVAKLHRVRIGGLHIGDLATGHWRDLTAEELETIKK